MVIGISVKLPDFVKLCDCKELIVLRCLYSPPGMGASEHQSTRRTLCPFCSTVAPSLPSRTEKS